jgi:hypothetical protein
MKHTLAIEEMHQKLASLNLNACKLEAMRQVAPPTPLNSIHTTREPIPVGFTTSERQTALCEQYF